MLAFPVDAQQTMESLCDEISQYVPIDGVEYQPGATEVPASLNSVQNSVYGSISIPVEINLPEYFDRPNLRSVPRVLLEPEISNIEVNQDGSIFYNGSEISQDIQRVCGTSDAFVEKDVVSDVPSPVPPKPNLQPSPQPAVQAKPAAISQPKKSSVSVFNGPKSVITNNVEPAPEQAQEPPLQLKPNPVEEKAPIVDENAIDVEDLKAQDNNDDAINGDSDEDRILEGQYP